MTDHENTGLGNYFVANYPPFSAWKPEHLTDAFAALDAPPRPTRRSAFICTSRFAASDASSAISASTPTRTLAMSSVLDALRRKSSCIASAGHRRSEAAFRLFRRRHPVLFERGAAAQACSSACRQIVPWHDAAEVTFECEPGTLQQHKLETLKESASRA